MHPMIYVVVRLMRIFQDIQDKNIQKINDFLSNIDSPIVLDHSACSAKLISDHSV